MSEFIYTKSFTGDFGSSFKQDQFNDEIKADGGISPVLLRVDRTGDNIEIVFDASLAGEETAFNTLITNHTPATYIGKEVNYLNVPKSEIKSTSYAEIISFEFPGKTKMDISTIKFVGYMKKNGSTYDVRLLDITHNVVLGEGSFTNESKSIQDLGTISNIPVDSGCVFELQAKVNGNSRCYIQNVVIYYN